MKQSVSIDGMSRRTRSDWAGSNRAGVESVRSGERIPDGTLVRETDGFKAGKFPNQNRSKLHRCQGDQRT